MPRLENTSILSSLPLQILLYFDSYYSIFYFALSIAFLIYKDVRYYYTSGAVAIEVCIIILFGIVQYIRLFLGSKGNKTESLNSLAVSMFLAAPACLAVVYLMALQTYVLRVDLILGIIAVIFLGLELMLSATTMINFVHAFRG